MQSQNTPQPLEWGVLLDSHSLLWLDEGSTLRASATLAISKARLAARLYVSEISIWEVGVAIHKKNILRRPNLRGLSPAEWFLDTAGKLGATPLPITSAIAAETGNVPAVSGYGDPGDCFLIATARTHTLALVTRDEQILTLATTNPTYLTAIAC